MRNNKNLTWLIGSRIKSKIRLFGPSILLWITVKNSLWIISELKSCSLSMSTETTSTNQLE